MTEYGTNDFDQIVAVLEAIPANLTAAIVSNDPIFREKLLGLTVNGTTYSGLRARTTGGPSPATTPVAGAARRPCHDGPCHRGRRLADRSRRTHPEEAPELIRH